MAQQNRSKVKRVPQRTCIACRKVEGKRSFVRIVRTTSGVEVDVTGKKSGRGAYLCSSRQCWQIALRTNRIEQALRTRLSAEERQALQAYGEQFSNEDEEAPVETSV